MPGSCSAQRRARPARENSLLEPTFTALAPHWRWRARSDMTHSSSMPERPRSCRVAGGARQPPVAPASVDAAMVSGVCPAPGAAVPARSDPALGETLATWFVRPNLRWRAPQKCRCSVSPKATNNRSQVPGDVPRGRCVLITKVESAPLFCLWRWADFEEHIHAVNPAANGVPTLSQQWPVEASRPVPSGCSTHTASTPSVARPDITAAVQP